MRSRNLIATALCAIVLLCAGTVLADVVLLCSGTVQFVAVQGRVKGNRMRTFEGRVDIPSDAAPAESVTVAYSLTLVDAGDDRIGSFEASKPKKLVVTLYDGTTEARTQLGKKTVRFNRDGGFQAMFEGLAPLVSYTITAKPKGGTFQDTFVESKVLAVDEAFLGEVAAAIGGSPTAGDLIAAWESRVPGSGKPVR